jgi:hypothetical protein
MNIRQGLRMFFIKRITKIDWIQNILDYIFDLDRNFKKGIGRELNENKNK